MNRAPTLHASCVVVGEAGLLIRGASGSGKSSLARQIVLEAERGGRFTRLVSDDRVRVENRNGRLVASAVAAIAGRLEVRGIGLLTLPYEKAAILRLVIDLADDPPRFPEAAEGTVMLHGVAVPRIEALIEPSLAGAILLRLHHPEHLPGGPMSISSHCPCHALRSAQDSGFAPSRGVGSVYQ